MAKKNGKRYTDQERARILADMERNGLTQVAAAKKHGVSAVTIWQWKRPAKSSKRQARAPRTTSASNGSLDGLLRTQVRNHIRQMLPALVRDEVARTLGGK